MSAKPANCHPFRLIFAWALAVSAATSLGSPAQPPETTKKSSDSKAVSGSLPIFKLPDGTYLWSDNRTESGGERVTLTLQDLQKLQEQIEQLKKQLAVQKPTPPSACAIRGRIEKRGEQLVAVLKINYSFRTALPQTAIALGGRKGFLISAKIDNNKTPVLETTDEGFAALVETPGDHTFTLDLETSVTARGAKTELGFELGLPRAPITTLTLDPPRPDLKLVNLTTRTSEPGQTIRPAEQRRVGVDLKQLSSAPPHETGQALGPVEMLEVTWDPPVATVQPVTEQVQSAELDITVLITEGAIETTAKFKLRGPTREWKIIAPPNADLTVERSNGTVEVGPTLVPTPSKPTDPNKPVWRIELPVGSSASDWTLTAATRQTRPKLDDPKHRGPFPIGPFAVLNVLRQTGTVRVTAGPHTHLTFKHGLELRETLPPGPAEDDVSTAFFRLITGPTGSTTPNQPPPLFTVEAAPQSGSVVVKPSYKLTLEKVPFADDVWRVRADIRVFPNHTTVDSLAIDIPSEWPEGAEASLPSESIPGVSLGTKNEGFWQSLAAKLTKGGRVPTILHLPAGQKQAFDLILSAIVRVPAGCTEFALPLLRFPNAFERDTTITVSVPEGQEVRGEVRGWDGETPATWGLPLNPLSGPNGRTNKTVTSLSGKSETSLSRVILNWNAALPELTTEIRAEVTITERQVEIIEHIKLRSNDGLPAVVRFRPVPGTSNIAGLKSRPTASSLGQFQQSHSAGEWLWMLPTDAKEATHDLIYSVPLDRRTSDRSLANLPIPLLWPLGATRSEATVRLWTHTASCRTITTLSPGWREIPPEPAPDRESLPCLALLGSTNDLPLILETREVGEASSITAWVDRALIQALVVEDEATRFRVQFLLHKWLGSALEIRLPATVAGLAPEFVRDNLKIEATLLPDAGGTGRVYRVPLPDPRPGKNVTIEIRYQLPTSRSDIGETTYPVPALANAVFTGPLRWEFTVPHGTIPLLVSGAIPEFHWRWRVWGLTPAPLRSDKELEKWFGAGEEHSLGEDLGNNAGETITVRQLVLEPITICRFPRNGFILVCSVLIFIAALTLIRLPFVVLAPVLAVLSSLVGINAILFPHVCAQIAGACQPGLAALAICLAMQKLIRSYYRHRVNHLPGFARIHLESLGSASPIPPSTRNRPAGLGSGSASPVAQAGG